MISAPSGGGKTTLCERLLRDFPVLSLSISTTTRAPRGKEQDGREYLFIDRAGFEQMINNGEFAEHALVHGHYYGTSRKVIDDAFRSGKSVLLDIDVQGAASLRQAYPAECFSIFVTPPDIETLEKRLRARKTDSEETIQKRMRSALAEMSRKDEFHKIIVNDELDRAYTELAAVVAKALGVSGVKK